MKKLIFILLSILLVAGSTLGANYYVLKGATGSNNGSDWTNAWNELDQVNWNTVASGGVLYVAAGTYTTGFPSVSVSGITVKRATVSDHGTATGWNSSYDAQVTVSYPSVFVIVNSSNFTFDGVSHSPWKFRVVGIRNANGMFQIYAANVTVRNIELDGMSENIGINEDAFRISGGNNLIIEHCYIHDYRQLGTGHNDAVQCPSGNNVTFRYNIFENSGQLLFLGDYAWGSQYVNGITIEHNLFYCASGVGGGCYNGIVLKGTNIDGTYTTKIENNTFAIRSDEAVDRCVLYGGDGNPNNNMTNSYFRNNNIYNSHLGHVSLVANHTYNNYYNPYNSSEVLTETGTLTVNPLFVNAASKDFHLQSGSPVINMGTTVGWPYDFDNNPIVGNPDMGAFEYQSGGGDTQAPSVPTGLASSSITQTSFTLSWTASTDNVGVTGYEVFKNGASIGTSASASMSVTGLTANTSYSMTVRARDAVPNWSAQSTALNVTTSAGSDTQAPSVPTGLTSSSITQTSFTLSWTASTDNVGVTGYEVFKNGASIGTSASASMSVTGLTASTTYSMTVRARDAVPNWSAQSTALNVTTQASGGTTRYEAENAALTGVSVVTGPLTGYSGTGYIIYTSFDATGDNITFTVNVPSTGSYPLTIRYCSENSNQNNYLVVNGGSQVDVSFPAVSVLTTLNYGNISLNAGNNTIEILKDWGYIDVDYIEIGGSAGDTQAPSVPTGLTSSSITQTSFTLSWTASTDNVGVTGYEVFKNGASIGTSASASMSVTGLTASTTYSMTVRARDAVPNWSAQSTALIVTTASVGDTQAPSVPTGLASSSIAQTSFTLNWTASTDNVGVTGYEVFKNGASIGTSATTSMSVTGLTASTTYSMTVRARDAVPNWSAQSTALKVMTASASVTSSTTWQSFTRSTQTGTFTAAFDAVPNTANMNGVTGIQNGTATDYPNLACAVRFYTAGKIEAINGGDGVYSSSTTVNYSAGTSYHFRLVINVTAHTYSIYVTPNGQGEVTLGTNYAFRSQQAGVTQLTGWSLVALTGTHTVSNMTFGTSGKISQAQNTESEVGNNADAMPSKPVTFSLSQNYPNPFNPTTNIEYRIANTGFVSLKIYDVLGREVSTLVNGQKSIGIYTVQWDASNLPSGVYFSRLTVQTQAGMPIVMTKKILFTK